MANRYFKCVNKLTLERVATFHAERRAQMERAEGWARRVGAEKVLYSREGFFGVRMAGFKAAGCSDDLLAKCTKPRRMGNGPLTVKPKKTADREFYKEWVQAVNATEMRCDDRDLVGFTGLDFFPTSPGFNYKPGEDRLVWVMPGHVETLEGCEEITNIEYIELTKES